MASIINAATSGGLISTADTSGILQLQTAGTTAVTVDASQNVTFAGVTTLQAGTAALPALTTSGDTNTGIFFPAADVIAFSTGGAERARILSGGQLLVGTTSNLAKLGVSFDGNADNGCVLRTSTNASGCAFLYFQQDTNTCGSILRVGTTSAVTYNTTSDYRLKTVTGAVTGQGSRIDALKPIDYFWKEGNHQSRGFLAHEFQTVYPNSVSGDKDDVDADGNPKHQSMQAATSEVIADLVAEIQSLRQRITALEGA